MATIDKQIGITSRDKKTKIGKGVRKSTAKKAVALSKKSIIKGSNQTMISHFKNLIENTSKVHKTNYAFSNTPNPSSRFKIIEAINSNTKSHIALEKLINISKIPLTKIAEEVLEINTKTLSSYRKSTKPLPTKLSEHIIKLIELYSKGIELFGNSKQFNLWMNSKAYGLNYHVPMTLMNSITGINLVYEELIRIEFGATA